MDMDEFVSLSGSDASRVIYQIIFAAKPGMAGNPEDHSVLVSGHFDRQRIYQSAINGGATSTNYHGFPVLEVKPFRHNENGMDEVRWLAVLDSGVLVLGSIAIVKEELDQQLASTVPDPRLMQLLAALRRDDDAWSVVLSGRSYGVREALMALSPELAEMAAGKTLRLGIRYARSVEFEYAIDEASENQPVLEPNSGSSTALRAPPGSFSLLGSLQLQSNRAGGIQGVIKVSKERYDRWVSELSRRRREITSKTDQH